MFWVVGDGLSLQVVGAAPGWGQLPSWWLALKATQTESRAPACLSHRLPQPGAFCSGLFLAPSPEISEIRVAACSPGWVAAEVQSVLRKRGFKVKPKEVLCLKDRPQPLLGVWVQAWGAGEGFQSFARQLVIG